MPDQPTTAQVTPGQAASSAAAQVVADRIAEQEKRLSDSLDIRDPGQPKPGPTPEQIQVQQGQQQQPLPKAIPGATADAGYTPELLARASAAQIPEAEARQYQPAHLERLLQRIEQTQFQPEYEPEPEPEPQQPFAFDPYTGQPLQQQPTQFDLPSLDPGKYDEELVQTWDQARQFMYQQQQIIADMQARLQETHQTVQQAQQQAAARESQQQYRQLESAIAKDEAYADVLGKGPAHLLKGTPQFYARVQVANMMDDIAQGYQRRGQAAPDIDVLYTQAKQAIFGHRVAETQQQQEARATAERLRNRQGQFIAKPTATTRADGWEAQPPGEERAVGAVAQAIRNQRNGNANN